MGKEVPLSYISRRITTSLWRAVDEPPVSHFVRKVNYTVAVTTLLILLIKISDALSSTKFWKKGATALLATFGELMGNIPKSLVDYLPIQ